ncbi:substrate-binding domain-containing protein [Intestinibacillus massiliensis]|uniref:substrate-binding domain-containing protein n=1 Tax=Intestinibacillus massiliensis TaxID=1871029 RepID=UPI00135662F4|nr:substrate-binding domain-containing protein [Intestinibacillus massiliensis]
MKKALSSVLAALMLSTALFGCNGAQDGATAQDTKQDAGTSAKGTAPAADKKVKIGITLATQNEFNTVLQNGCENRAKQNGYTIDVQIANEDMSTQISQIRTFASSGCDAIVIQAVLNDSVGELLDAAGDVPVALVNRMPTDLSVLDGQSSVYVGSNEHDFGYYQGQYLAEMLKADGVSEAKVCLFRGPLGQDSVRLRSEGADEALKDAGLAVTYVFDDTAEWDRAKALDKMVQFIGTGKEYNCVVCNNDEMALGVIEAYVSSGISEPPVPVCGIDATENGCQAIKAGTLACSVFQDAAGQGAMAVDAAAALFSGEKPEGMSDDNIVWVPVVAVSPDNVDEFIQ